MTHSIGKDVLLVEVPQDAREIILKRGNLWAFTHSEQTFRRRIIVLPPGNWQYITTSDVITEEQAAEIVERYKEEYFKDYKGDGVCFYTALESFKSLLRSLSITPRVAILKKQ